MDKSENEDILTEDNRPRYKAVCCKCGNVFYACKSMAQEMGSVDAGCGSCPECKTFLNLTFDELAGEMKTLEWDKYVKDNKEKDKTKDKTKDMKNIKDEKGR